MSLTRVPIQELPSEIRKALQASGNRKRDALVFNTTFRPGHTVLTGWDGGSRDTFHWVLKGGALAYVDLQPDPNRMGDPWGQRKVLPPAPPEAIAFLTLGISQGKPASPVIQFINPNEWAPKAQEEAS